MLLFFHLTSLVQLLYLGKLSRPKMALNCDFPNATILGYEMQNYHYVISYTYYSDATFDSSSSCVRDINHNWSATKQRLHPQSVAEISCHSVLSGDRIRQCETSSGSRHKDTDQCL